MKSRYAVLIVTGALLSSVSGCTSATKATNENLQKGLVRHFESRNECLFPTALKFPYEVSPGSSAREEKKRMDALTEAGLLLRQEELAIKVDRYTLTALGTRVGGRFCYGHRQILSVNSFTPPENRNGFIETTVSYNYSMAEVPVWVKTDEMRAAFPQMAKAISGPQSDQKALATVGAGWQVPE